MIHIVTGPPCSGKSTYVRENAEPGDLIVDFDVIAKALGSVEAHNAEGVVLEAARGARDAAIGTACKNDTGWIIDTNLSGSYPDTAEIILLDPGKDVCVERAKQDNRPEGTLAAIDRWYARRKGGKYMNHKTKDFALVKSDEGAGTISGYFSTYDWIPDSYGDVIEKGAFTGTIKAREASGHPLPLCWNHDLNQIIGAVAIMEDDDHGPRIDANFLDTALAQEKRELVKRGIVHQFSFAYDVLGCRKPTSEERKAGIKNILTKLDVFEVSIVPIPANPRAEVTDIKSGRRNSKKDADAIKQAIALLQGVLDEADDDEGKDDPKGNSEEKDPEGSNPEKNRLLEYIKKLEMED